MWDILHNQVDNTHSKLGRTQIHFIFRFYHPAKDEKMNTYSTPQIDYCNQLGGSAEEISEASFVTPCFTHISKEFATTTIIFERPAARRISQLIMHSIPLGEEKAAFGTKITDT